MKINNKELKDRKEFMNSLNEGNTCYLRKPRSWQKIYFWWEDNNEQWFMNKVYDIREDGVVKPDETWVVLIFAVPVAWLFINYQKFAYLAFDSSLWSLRLMGFSGGIIVFFIMTWLLMGELPSVKNLVCLILACCIIGIQTLLK